MLRQQSCLAFFLCWPKERMKERAFALAKAMLLRSTGKSGCSNPTKDWLLYLNHFCLGWAKAVADAGIRQNR
jgi:hypothetical protein